MAPAATTAPVPIERPGRMTRAVADPDVMADSDVMLAPPCKEFGVVAHAGKIGAGAVGEMRLRRRGASDDCPG